MRILIVLLLLIAQTAFGQDIHQAARANDLKAIQHYLAQNIAVDTVDARGFTPLILAVYNQQMEAATLLLAQKANVNAADYSGNTALMGACFKGDLKAVELLLANKATVNQQNLNQATALIFAATFGHSAIVKILLAQGADKDIADSRGLKALDHATMQENNEIISLLK